MSMGCHEILHLIVEPHSRAQPGNTELKTIYQKEISPAFTFLVVNCDELKEVMWH